MLDVLRGYYVVPMVLNDFNSLYPNTMIQYGLSYDTYLGRKVDAALALLQRLGYLALRADGSILVAFQPKGEGASPVSVEFASKARAIEALSDLRLLHVTPAGACFIGQHFRVGIVPQFQTELLDGRDATKELLKAEKDPVKKKQLDNKQNAQKLAANGSYGVTGSSVFNLPCISIAEGTCGFGRVRLIQAKEFIERQMALPDWVLARCGSARPVTLFGDTDSVGYVQKGVETLEEAFRFGKHVSDALLAGPLKGTRYKMLLEGVYARSLFIAKKRRAFAMSEKPTEAPKEGVKGIETKRRDFAPFTADAMSRFLTKVLIDADPLGAFAGLERTVDDVRRGDVDPSLFVMSKMLSKDPLACDEKLGADRRKKMATEEAQKALAYSKSPHVAVALKMYARDPQSMPKSSDRVPCVHLPGSRLPSHPHSGSSSWPATRAARWARAPRTRPTPSGTASASTQTITSRTSCARPSRGSSRRSCPA